MTELALLGSFIMFIALGLLSPFVFSLGYVWVDTLLPHRLSYGLLSNVPMAFIVGAGAFFSYLLMDRKNPPRITLILILCFILAAWITLTSTWAVAPGPAWSKWDVAFKTLLFGAFTPFIFRSRIQIEAFILVLSMSAAAHLLPWGFKTFFTGGGYQMSLGLLNSNASMISESSSVATITVMFVPLLVWVRRHSLLIPVQTARTVLTSFMIVLYLVANIGTFARTGLIGFGVLSCGMLLKTKRKFLFIFLAVILGSVVMWATSDRWLARVSTISNYENEGSAYTRILIWKWTLNFAMSNPLGGGFNAYVINVIYEPPDLNGVQKVQYGRAFHNIYMAALGEHGYPGLAIYVAILVLSLISMQRTIRQCRGMPDLEWAADLARAAQIGLLILMACGTFIDISFSFMIWDLVGLGMCLRNHVRQVLHPVTIKLHPSQVAGARLPSLSDGSGRPAPQLRSG